MEIRFIKQTALPAIRKINSIYFIEGDGDGLIDMYVTDVNAQLLPVLNKALMLQLLAGYLSENPIPNEAAISQAVATYMVANPITAEPGDDGRQVELFNNGSAISWRYAGDVGFNELVQLSALRGNPGIIVSTTPPDNPYPGLLWLEI